LGFTMVRITQVALHNNLPQPADNQFPVGCNEVKEVEDQSNDQGN
jgi:hypothetical protein